MPLRPELIRAYEKADYVLYAEPDVVLRIGEPSEVLDLLLELMGAETAAWLTAANPRGEIRPAAENESALDALSLQLFEEGHMVTRGEARDPAGVWPAEPSLLVTGMPRAEAEALGRRLEQNAIVFIEKGRAPELLLLD